MSHYSTLKGLGRAIAYFPQLGIHLGNPLAGIFLSQLVYWHDKTDCDLGVYKTSEEWQKETGLTYSHQKTARKLLKDLGILSETEKRLEHKLYFKLNIEKFDEWFESCINSDQNREQEMLNPRTRNPTFGDERKAHSGAQESFTRGEAKSTSVIHKITTENATEITSIDSRVAQTKKSQANRPKFDAKNIDLSEYPNVSLEAWTGFAEMRQAIKKPLTERAAKIILKKLQVEYQDQANAVLDQSTVNNYQDIYPLKTTPIAPQAKPHSQQPYQKRFGGQQQPNHPMRDVGGENR